MSIMVTFQAVENNGDGIFQELANISSTLLTVQGGQPQPASMQKAGWITSPKKARGIRKSVSGSVHVQTQKVLSTRQILKALIS